jgi:electron transfer flavoprotein alpha subunit
MKIVVLVKQVPNVADMAIEPATRTLRREGVKLEVSAFDVRALVRAVELRSAHGGEVVVLTMGPPQARDALLHCLALGADRGVLVSDPACAGADTLATARVLAAALRREGFDLVLAGRASVDAETGQVGPEVAELLALPQITGAMRLDVDPAAGRVTAVRETDAGTETVAAALPVLVTAGEDVAPERFPRRADKEAAKTKPIATLGIGDLGLAPDAVGAAGSPTWVAGVETVEHGRAGRLIEGEPEAVAEALVRELVARGLFAAPAPAAASPSAAAAGAPSTAGGGAFWAVAETLGTDLRRVSLELLGKASALAAVAGGEAVAVVLGHDLARHAETLGAHGAARVLLVDHPALADYATEPWTAALATLVAARAPRAVLLPSTAFGRDLAPRVAARLGLGLTGDCIDLGLDAEGRLVQWKPAFGGNVVAPVLSRTRPEMATVRPGILPPAPPVAAGTPAVETVAAADLPVPRVRVTARAAEAGPDPAAALDQADVTIGVGIGIGGPEALRDVERLAAALGGAALAATRDVTDKGWLARGHQVGLTGRAIAPRFYLALGIRGAFEHTVGIRRAGTIVAVDRNPKAPMLAQADLAGVADWRALLEPLIAALERARAAARH